MGESDTEKAAGDAAKNSTTVFNRGIDELEDVRTRFEGSDIMKTLGPLIQGLVDQPFTFTDQLKSNLRDQSAGQIAQATQGLLPSLGAAERLGLGRSAAGGSGLNRQADLAGLVNNLQAGNNIDIQAAQQRPKDIQNALGLGTGFLQSLLGPSNALAQANLGGQQGFTNLSQVLGQQAASETGFLDFLPSLIGLAAAPITGGTSLFGSLLGGGGGGVTEGFLDPNLFGA